MSNQPASWKTNLNTFWFSRYKLFNSSIKAIAIKPNLRLYLRVGGNVEINCHLITSLVCGYFIFFSGSFPTAQQYSKEKTYGNIGHRLDLK